MSLDTIKKSPRINSLDGLRAVSILLVCVGHLAGTVNFPELLTPLHNIGNFGVKIFFVISGFLITLLLLQEKQRSGSINLKQFYIRRTMRLFPAFYFYILCIALADMFGFITLFSGDILHAATYTMNYHSERSWWLNHTWSLAVEEQFYLIWPSLICLFGMMRAKNIAIAAIFIIPVVRIIMWYGFDASPSAMTRQFEAIADALATGCLLAYLHQGGLRLPKWCNSSIFILVPISMVILPTALYKIDSGLFYTLGQTYVNLTAAIMILRYMSVCEGVSYKILNSKLAIWLGGMSYSLYLWQEPFLNSWVTNWYASWPTNLILTLICACFSFYLIEKPLMQRKYRFYAKPALKTKNMLMSE
jgi:peptidoglycan/LPS O-acetylase OafA/YrhL